jgi:hypothetical protein
MMTYETYLHQPISLSVSENQTTTFRIPLVFEGNPKLFKSFLLQVKRIIRTSVEYNQWKQWIHGMFGPGVCAVSQNIAAIEVHHHPLTLEDYIYIALSYFDRHEYAYTSMLVADIVMRWHYEHIVGAVFLSTTYHERFHEFHDVVIPESSIHCDFEKLFSNEIIRAHMEPAHLAKFEIYCPGFTATHAELFVA